MPTPKPLPGTCTPARAAPLLELAWVDDDVLELPDFVTVVECTGPVDEPDPETEPVDVAEVVPPDTVTLAAAA